MKRKNRGRLTVILILSLLIVSIVRLLFSITDYEYLKSSDCFKELFVESVYDQLEFGTGMCNEVDTLCSYTYNNYHISIWKIGMYSKINSTHISLLSTKRISSYYFRPTTSIDFGRECTVTKKEIKVERKKIGLILNENVRVDNKTISLKGFKTDKFGIGDNDEGPDIVFDFKNKDKEIEFAIKKFNNQSVIIVLFPMNKNNIEGGVLQQILR